MQDKNTVFKKKFNFLQGIEEKVVFRILSKNKRDLVREKDTTEEEEILKDIFIKNIDYSSSELRAKLHEDYPELNRVSIIEFLLIIFKCISNHYNKLNRTSWPC